MTSAACFSQRELTGAPDFDGEPSRKAVDTSAEFLRSPAAPSGSKTIGVLTPSRTKAVKAGRAAASMLVFGGSSWKMLRVLKPRSKDDICVEFKGADIGCSVVDPRHTPCVRVA